MKRQLYERLHTESIFFSLVRKGKYAAENMYKKREPGGKTSSLDAADDKSALKFKR